MTEVDDDLRRGFVNFSGDALDGFSGDARDFFLPCGRRIFSRFYDSVKSDRKFFYKFFIVGVVFYPRMDEG